MSEKRRSTERRLGLMLDLLQTEKKESMGDNSTDGGRGVLARGHEERQEKDRAPLAEVDQRGEGEHTTMQSLPQKFEKGRHWKFKVNEAQILDSTAPNFFFQSCQCWKKRNEEAKSGFEHPLPLHQKKCVFIDCSALKSALAAFIFVACIFSSLHWHQYIQLASRVVVYVMYIVFLSGHWRIRFRL